MTKVLNNYGRVLATSAIGAESTDVLATFLDYMEAVPNADRVTIFQILSDYFCPYCGVEQPEGDCQCSSIKP